MFRVTFIFLCLFGFNAFSNQAEKIEISTANGKKLDAFILKPLNTKGKTPALIIAPGQGYHMGLPLVKDLAQKASENGILTVGFNWSYYTEKGNPSEELINEKQNMEDVLTYVRGLKSVDTKKILVAGKSLGTLVAYSVFQNHKDLFSLYLLTPICTWEWDEEEKQVSPFPVADDRYPNFLQEKRPIHISLGNKDKLCQTDMLYDFLKNSKNNITSSIFGGDHGMNIGKWSDPKFKDRNAANIKSAIDSTVHWMNVHLQK